MLGMTSSLQDLLSKRGTNWAASPYPSGSSLCYSLSCVLAFNVSLMSLFFPTLILIASISVSFSSQHWSSLPASLSPSLPNTDPHCQHLCLLLCREDHFGASLCLAQHYYHLFTEATLGIYDVTCSFSSSHGVGDKILGNTSHHYPNLSHDAQEQSLYPGRSFDDSSSLQLILDAVLMWYVEQCLL